MEQKGTAKLCPFCGYAEGAAPEAALHLPPGTVLENKYLLGRALGQGGFGITYIAWDRKLNLKLAIKEYLPIDMASRATGQATISVYKKELADSFQYGLDKYLEEARTLARFAGHPGIVWVRDYFEANGTAYIVMEYIEGVTLKEYLAKRKEPLYFKQALTVFVPVLDALKEVHAEDILHRDISPDNILIDKRGRVVLIDFGAARQAVGEQSRSLSVIMKPGFSPEEQYHSRGNQGPWTDIYAAAASIYLAVTGIIPPESLSRLSEETLVPPSKLGIKIEPLYEQALLKALAVRAKDRYQTVEEFQKVLLEDDNKREKPAGGAVIAERADQEKGIRGVDLAATNGLGTAYYIDYENGTIPLSDLPIGTRVVDPTWNWEFRSGNNYSGSGVKKPLTWILVSKNHYEKMEPHVTLLSEELIGSHALDNSTNLDSQYGSNHWGDSGKGNATRGLRPCLNSTGIHSGEGFYRTFSESFKNAVLTTSVPNKEWEKGKVYSTSDQVFIPSTTELGDSVHNYTYQIGSVYPYFQGTGDAKRVALFGIETRWYWTRSPDWSRGDSVRSISSAGEFYGYSAYFDSLGVRPALNLKSETLVSEINH